MYGRSAEKRGFTMGGADHGKRRVAHALALQERALQVAPPLRRGSVPPYPPIGSVVLISAYTAVPVSWV